MLGLVKAVLCVHNRLIPAQAEFDVLNPRIDLTGAITFAEHYTVRVGANNLFDKDPPLNGSSSCPTGPCNGNTWPQVYDTLGRQLFLTFTSNF